MDDLIEFFIELLIDGSIEISKSKKVPKWIRYPIIIVLILLFSLIFLLLIYFGLSLLKESIIFGSIILLITFILLVSGIKKIKKIYKERDE